MVYPSIMEPKVVVVMEEYAQITKWGFCNTIGKVGVKKNQKKNKFGKKKRYPAILVWMFWKMSNKGR